MRRNITENSTLTLESSATDPDTETNAVMLSYIDWRRYDEIFNDANINEGITRLLWMQSGLNPQSFTLSGKLHETNFPSGVYKVAFIANDGFNNGMVSVIYLSVDDPARNDRPYILEIPEITVSENDISILDLDKYGIDPDRNISTLGMLTYSITTSEEFSRAKLCGRSSLTNNLNHILTINPETGDAGGLGGKTIDVILKAEDEGSPVLSFTRTFKLNILPRTDATIITNPFNLANCFVNPPPDDEIDIPIPPLTTTSSSGEVILEPEAAKIGKFSLLPKVFNPGALNIPEIFKAIKGSSQFSESKLLRFLFRAISKQLFKDSLISGGKAFVVLKLHTDAKLKQEEIMSLNYSLLTELESKVYPISPRVVSFNPNTNELLLEIELTDDIPPGEALLKVKRNEKIITEAKLSILPVIIAKNIKDKTSYGKPIIRDIKVKAPEKGVRKQYKIIITGENLIGQSVLINNKLIKSPVINQPFSLITFTNTNGLTVQSIRLSKDAKKLKVLINYDSNLIKETSDIRLFTISTISGQTTGQVDLKNVEKTKKK